jgi:hypothetical protein
MSSALTKAIYARLTGTEVLTGAYLTAQQRIKALLAEDPDTLVNKVKGTGKPAIFKANLSDFTIFPCITFRENGGMPDRRFTMGNASTGGVVVDNVFYDLEVWGKSRSGIELSDIDDQLRLLLDRRYGAPVLLLADGDVQVNLTFVSPSMLYDEKRNAWFLLRRIKFNERYAV